MAETEAREQGGEAGGARGRSGGHRPLRGSCTQASQTALPDIYRHLNSEKECPGHKDQENAARTAHTPLMKARHCHGVFIVPESRCPQPQTLAFTIPAETSLICASI